MMDSSLKRKMEKSWDRILSWNSRQLEKLEAIKSQPNPVMNMISRWLKNKPTSDS